MVKEVKSIILTERIEYCIRPKNGRGKLFEISILPWVSKEFYEGLLNSFQSNQKDLFFYKKEPEISEKQCVKCIELWNKYVI